MSELHRMGKREYILIFSIMLAFVALPRGYAQQSVNDTIRLGGIEVDGKVYPFVFLPEFDFVIHGVTDEEKKRINKLRNNIYTVYPYALTAGTIFKSVNAELDKLPDRRARKHYLKSIDKQLDACFKEPLKNLSIEQGHILIKLIDRQTGESCYEVIKELKGGFSAVMWQSVGIFFNNNLTHSYDPEGRDNEVESIVRELEASNAYRYQLYLQEEMMKRIGKK